MEILKAEDVFGSEQLKSNSTNTDGLTKSDFFNLERFRNYFLKNGNLDKDSPYGVLVSVYDENTLVLSSQDHVYLVYTLNGNLVSFINYLGIYTWENDGKKRFSLSYTTDEVKSAISNMDA